MPITVAPGEPDPVAMAEASHAPDAGLGARLPDDRCVECRMLLNIDRLPDRTICVTCADARLKGRS